MTRQSLAGNWYNPLRGLATVRRLNLRHEDRLFTNSVYYIEQAALELPGAVNPTPWEYCTNPDRGSYDEFVSLPGVIRGCCANC